MKGAGGIVAFGREGEARRNEDKEKTESRQEDPNVFVLDEVLYMKQMMRSSCRTANIVP